MPEVGRSFRDSTRVAGANPAIWADIFAANRDAVADEIDAVVGAPARRPPSCCAPATPRRSAAWHRGARDDRRRAARGRGRRRARCSELRVVVDNRPGTVAEIALALGEAGVNIEDMALDPAADMRPARSRSGSRATTQARARGRDRARARPLGVALPADG